MNILICIGIYLVVLFVTALVIAYAERGNSPDPLEEYLGVYVFWPITLPLLAVAGAVYALFSGMSKLINWIITPNGDQG